MKGYVAVMLAALAPACAHEHDELQPIIVQPAAVVLDTHVVAGGDLAPARRVDPTRILILPSKRPDRPSEVVGVVDAHVPMGDHDRALAVLKEKAAALGADAVIGVDFEHGEGHAGEPLHLSGLAVRWIDRPLPRD